MGGGEKALGYNNNHDYLNEHTSQLRRELVLGTRGKTLRAVDGRWPAREQRLMMAQIREDFRRLQSINAEGIRPSITTGVFDYAKIAKASSNIERRAVRLKNNLVLPDTSDTRPQPEDTLTYLDQVKRLDSAIWSFVSNPIFQTAKVVDAQLSAKASRDLHEIIRISRLLKRKRN